jgi:hypothetical protein
MAPANDAAQFRTLFVEALSDRSGNAAKPRKTQERDYQKLSQFVRGLTDPKSLDACVEQYLKLYPQHSPNDPRSKQIFVILVEHRVERTKPGDTYAADMKARFHDTREPPAEPRVRFDSLDAAQRQELDTRLTPPKEPPKGVLQLLREAYRNHWGWDAKTQEDLYDFDPKPDATLEANFRAVMDLCDRTWTAAFKTFSTETVDLFAAAFKGYGDFVAKYHGDALALWQMLNWCWRPHVARTKKGGRRTETQGTPASNLERELYLRLVMGLYVCTKNLTLKGFTDEETRVLFAPLDGATYSVDYGLRFVYGMTNVRGFYDMSQRHLQLLLVAHAKNVDLVPAETTAQILTLYEVAGQVAAEHKDETPPKAAAEKDTKKKKRLQTISVWDVNNDRFDVGDTLGAGAAELHIVYIDFDQPSPVVYVEFTTIRGVFFSMAKAQFQSRVEAMVRQLVWRDNAGLADLIQAFVEFCIDWLAPELSYLDVFVEHGAVAVLAEYAKNKVFEIALDGAIKSVGLLGVGIGGTGIGFIVLGGKMIKGMRGKSLSQAKKYASAMFERSMRGVPEELERETERLTTHEAEQLGVHVPPPSEESTLDDVTHRMADKENRRIEAEAERPLREEEDLQKETVSLVDANESACHSPAHRRMHRAGHGTRPRAIDRRLRVSPRVVADSFSHCRRQRRDRERSDHRLDRPVRTR